MPKVTIIGAGLAGSLLAIYLARRGFAVDIYESRGDMRKEQVAAGRSINLALSDRGIAALRQVGMDEYMLAEAIPMHGRMIHSSAGETKLLPYSGRNGEYINSISRGGLNIALINEAEKYPRVNFHFNEPCVDFDCLTGEARLESGKVVKADTLIATDGAGSAVRQAMERQLPNFQMSSVFLEHGYKELHIPPLPELQSHGITGPHQTARGIEQALGPDRDLFAIEKNVLHIWPRHKFMMIALPNFDGSFTCTLFLAHKSISYSRGDVDPASVDRADLSREPSFDRLTDRKSLHDFFEREFPDAMRLMPTIEEDFFENPTGLLGTVKCFPWNVGGKALLLGDSAHAVVPFYGQGMNCAFEDVRVLDELIEKHIEPIPLVAESASTSIDWEAIYVEFGNLRKANTDAIADMAEENFYEMRDATADPVFVKKRELETKLEQTFPDYFSKYSMVTFREDLPYSIAKAKGNVQDKLLMEICRRIESVSELDLDDVIEQVRSRRGQSHPS